jgi:N-methylhydantoinase B/oxoprolinase/acetone carboxylase alpha subunit
VFDFDGTDMEFIGIKPTFVIIVLIHIIEGNVNAPRAITTSAIIYCLRCLVKRDIPLNQGCLNPIKIIVPPGSLLDPSDTAAVVGGAILFH